MLWAQSYPQLILLTMLGGVAHGNELGTEEGVIEMSEKTGNHRRKINQLIEIL
jgi:hypothetical protein